MRIFFSFLGKVAKICHSDYLETLSPSEIAELDRMKERIRKVARLALESSGLKKMIIFFYLIFFEFSVILISFDVCRCRADLFPGRDFAIDPGNATRI